jgi:hypothetical protein
MIQTTKLVTHSLGEFEQAEHLATAHEIWSTLEKFHEGNDHVKTTLFEMYRRKYDNFVPLAGDHRHYVFLVPVLREQDACQQGTTSL